MRALRYVLFLASLLVILACGGLNPFGTGNHSMTVNGIAFSNTRFYAEESESLNLHLEVWAAHSEEANQQVRVFIGGPLDEGETQRSMFVLLGPLNAHVSINIPIVARGNPGEAMEFTAGRQSIVSDIRVRAVEHRIVVGRADLQASLDRTAVTVARGLNAETNLSLLPVDQFSGRVTLSCSDRTVTFTPSTLTLQRGQSTPSRTKVSVRTDSLSPNSAVYTLNAIGDGASTQINFRVAIQGDEGSIQAAMNPTDITIPVMGSGTSTIQITPTGGFHGDVELASAGNVTFTPSTVTIASGQTTPSTSTVHYQSIVANPATDNVAITATGHNGAVSNTTLVVHQVAASTFTLTATPGAINVHPGLSTEALSVTLTPDATFNADVQVSVSFQSADMSLDGLTNPFTVHVAAGSATNRTFKLRWNPQGGNNPGGTATVTATGGGVTRSTTFNLIAS